MIMTDMQFTLFCYAWTVTAIVVYAYIADRDIRKKVNECVFTVLGLSVLAVKSFGMFLARVIRREIRQHMYARNAQRGYIPRDRIKKLGCDRAVEPYRHVQYTPSEPEAKPIRKVCGALSYDYVNLSEGERGKIL